MPLAFASLVCFLLFVFFEPALLFPALATFRVAFVVALIALAAAVLSGARPPKAGQTWALAFFVVWAGLSTLSAVSVDQGMERFPFFFKAVALFAIVTMVVRSSDRLLRFAYITLGLGAVVSMTTILTTRAGIAGLKGGNLYRMANYFGGIGDDPNEFGAFMLAMLPVPVVFFQHERSWVKKVMFALVALSFVLCITRTRSRGAFVGLLLVLPLLFWEGRRSAAAIFLGLMVVGYTFTHTHADYWERVATAFSETAIEEDFSASSRLEQQAYALQLLGRRPLLGVGPGNFVPAKIELLGLDPDAPLTRLAPHNAYFGLAAEIGIPGLLAFLTAILLSYRSLKFAEQTFQGHPETLRLRQLAKALRIGIMGFCVAIFFLSEQFNLILYMWIAMSVVLHELATRHVAVASKAPTNVSPLRVARVAR